MKTNGVFQYAVISDPSEEDEYGEAVSSEVVWSKGTECCITTNTDNRLGDYDDGEFRVSAYTVLLETSVDFMSTLVSETNLPITTEDGEYDITLLTSMFFAFILQLKRVKLTRYHEYLGEFRIQSVEQFPQMGRIKLNVV